MPSMPLGQLGAFFASDPFQDLMHRPSLFGLPLGFVLLLIWVVKEIKSSIEKRTETDSAIRRGTVKRSAPTTRSTSRNRISPYADKAKELADAAAREWEHEKLVNEEIAKRRRDADDGSELSP